MWQEKSGKLVLLAAMTAFLGGGIFPSMAKDGLTVNAGQTVSLTDGTSYNMYDDQSANGISVTGSDSGTMAAQSIVNIGDGKGTVHIKSETGEAGNSTANGVSVGPGGNLVINGNVDISSVYSGSCFANGLGIVNGGSGEGTQAYLAVNGNVTIGDPSLFSSLTDESTDKNWGVNAAEMHGGVGVDGHTSAGSGDANYSGARWHPTGISITANGHKSVIDLNGNVYAAIRGTALALDPYRGDTGISDYDLAVINANKGDVTILTPQSTKETYYAAASYGGSININSDGTNAAGHKVVMQGNVLAMKSNNDSGEPYFYQDGRVNIGLDTADSVWTGVVDNSGAKQTGEVNLWLQNGATWNHQSMSKTNGIQVTNLPYPSSEHYGKYDKKTHVASLVGSTGDAANGFIYQKETTPIYVNNYSGNVTLAYGHDSSNNIVGGDFYISHAAEGSSITVVTDRSNLPNGFDSSASTADWNTVSTIMSNLAQKLYYTANDGHLVGKVGIAEGLTASSQLLRVGNMTFGTNGQGSYTADPAPTIPSSQTDTSFTTAITGVKADDQKYVNTGVLKDEGQHYVFTKDTTITAANTINVGAVDHAVDINAKGHTLTLDSETDGTGTTSALAANSLNGVTITADRLVIKASNKGRMEAINIGGQGQQNKDTPNKLTINGDVDMQVNGSNYALGLYAAGNSEVTFNGNISAMGDTDNTWGLTSEKGAFGYYGVSLLYSGSNYALQTGPKVTINGDVNARIDGNGLFANGGGTRFTVNGGGNIEINKDNTHNYYAMIAESGTTSMNVNLDENYNATSARTNKLVLKGNVTASTGAVNSAEPELHSVVNLGLATKDSAWTGVAYNKFPIDGKKSGNKVFTGAINLFLQNGATWNNEEWGAVETSAWGAAAYTGSHLTKLVGGDSLANAGIINQNDAHDITVDNYSGSTKVIYKHDSMDPKKISGGSFRITNAAEGSAITLMTDRTGLTDGFSGNDSIKSINTVNEVLNQLAQKLFYTNYTDNHLAGTVEIADGLTASSVSLKSGPITFSDGTNGTKTAGQGFYSYTAIPESQTDTEFTDTITGVKSSDQKYVYSGVLKDNGEHYVFTKDSTITAANTINVGAVDHAVDINAKGHTLTLDSETDGTGTTSALAANSLNGVTITADKLVIKASNKGRMEAINIGGQGQQNKDTPNKLTINGDVDMQVNGSNYALGLYAAGNSEVTFNGNISAMGDTDNTWGLTSEKGAFGYYGVSLLYSGSNYALQTGPKVTINGDVNARIDGNGLFANGGGTRFTVNGGGNIEINKDNTHNYYAMIAESGTTSMNVNLDENYNATSARTNKLVLKGNVTASTGAVNSAEPELHSVVNLGLATKDSAWTGVAYNKFPIDGKKSGNKVFTGAINLFLQNGATWNNEEWGAVETSAWGAAAYTGSHLTKLVGGDSAANAGIINQNDANAITVDNYSGSTKVIYKHDATDPTKISGGSCRITNAAEGSAITLMTDRTGLTDGFKNTDSSSSVNTVNEVLDQLAQKLFYTNYADNHLAGTVEIADGLTASSASLKRGPISFSDGTTGTRTAGQGYYDYTPVIDGEAPIYLAYVHDNMYYKGYVSMVDNNKKDLIYDFGKAVVNIKADEDMYNIAPIGKPGNPDAKGVINAGQLNLTMLYSGMFGTSAMLIPDGTDLTINSDMNMEIKGGEYSVAGINMGHLGTGSGKKTTVTINGNLTSRGTGTDASSDDYWGVMGESENGGYDTYKGNRWAPSGIYLGSEGGSSITVNGDVDLAVKGNGVVADAYYKVDGENSLDNNITISGGTVEVPTTGDRNFYSLASYGGTINFGMNDAKDDAGSHAVKLTGNVLAMKDDGNADNEYYFRDGAINIGLGTKDSKWSGIIDNSGASQAGTVNVYMKNGAQWIHEAQGAGDGLSASTMPNLSKKFYGTYDGISHVALLKGADSMDTAGTIAQKDKADIDITSLAGNVKVSYDTLDGTGNIKVAGVKDSGAVLLTEKSSTKLDTTSHLAANYNASGVNGLLNSLANKLYYTAGDNKLTGTVSLLDDNGTSIIDAAVSYSSNGQGFFNASDAVDTITGLKRNNMNYVVSGILKDDGEHYVFTKDDSIVAANTVNVGNVGHAVDISAKGHTLTLDSETTGTGTTSALAANSLDGVTITADKLVIKASNKGRMEAINIGGQGQQNKDTPNKLTINGDVDMQVNGSNYALGLYAAGNSEVTFNGNISAMGDTDNTWGLTSEKGAFGYYGVSLLYSGSNYALQTGPKVTINGDVNARIDGNGLFANGGGTRFTVNGGGNIEINKDNTHNYYAMIAESGTTSMNVNLDENYNATSARTNKLVLKGNVTASTGAVNSAEPELHSVVNLGLATKDSAWTGVAYNKFPIDGKKSGNKVFKGAINLFLQNGATWNNEEWGAVETSAWGAAAYTGSHLTKLVGGDSLANAGIINQNDAHDITVDNYSGNTMVVYKHDIVDDTTRDHAVVYGNKVASIIGGDFRITDAAADSSITLVTDRAGLNLDSTAYTDKNLVNDTLDKLANKLYYTNYSNGNLKAYVQIAEGLTSSSITAALRKESVAFYNADEATEAGKKESQGHYAYTIEYPDHQIADPMSTVIDGSKESKDTYRDNGIYHDSTDSYDFTNKPNSSVNTDGKSDSIIHAGESNVNVTNDSELNITAKEGGYGIKAENGKTVTTKGNTNISASKGTGVLADGGSVEMNNSNTVIADTGIEAKNGGKVSASGKTDITATGNALHADGDGSTIALQDGTISGAVLAENKGTITTNGAALKGDVKAASDGTVALTNGSTSEGITADGGTITANGTDVTGDALAKANGTVTMTNGKAGTLTADGGTVTTNGTEVAGDTLAKENGTVAMTNGKAASVTAEGGTASTDGTKVDGLISAKNGGKASMRNGSAKGLSADKDSTVTAVLDKADAKLDGDVANEGTASISLSNGASWTGDSTGTGTTTASIGSGSTWTGVSSNGNTKAVIDGTWAQTGASKLASLSGSGTIDKRNDNNGDLDIASYSGSNTFVYSHSIVDDSTRENAEYYGDKNGGNKAVSVSGGNINITEAAKGSTINLMTDRAGLNVDSTFFRDKNLTNDALDKLANKLYYHGTESLTGRVGFGEGLTAPSAWKDITFKADGQGSYNYETIVNSLDIQYGSEETAMMKGTKSALLGSAMMWRSNNNDIQRRMGDLRLGQGETGVWARYMGGKNKYDQQNTYLNQDYDIGQAGFDKKVGDWTVGLAIDHGDGKSHYIGGRGKEKMNTLAIYGTRVSNDGRYFDVIVKTGQVKNKFDVSNEIGNRLHGDYKAWGNSISLEYGKRFVQDSGFYLDPSVEFTAGRLNGKNFTGTSDLGTLYVHQHGFNSAIGRIGFSIGRQLPKSNLYAKLALAHEFAGDFKTDFYADDGGLKSTKVDLSDTWLDMELGGSLSLGKNVYLYGTYTRTFEADMATKWRADVGVRYTF